MSSLPDIFLTNQPLKPCPKRQGPVFTLKHLTPTLTLKSSTQAYIIQPQEFMGFGISRYGKSQNGSRAGTSETERRIKRVSFTSDVNGNYNMENGDRQRHKRTFSKQSTRSIYDDVFGLPNSRACLSIGGHKQQKGQQAESIIHKLIQSQHQVSLNNLTLTQLQTEKNELKSQLNVLESNTLKYLEDLTQAFEIEIKKMRSNLSLMRRETGQESKANKISLDNVGQQFVTTKQVFSKISKKCQIMGKVCMDNNKRSSHL